MEGPLSPVAWLMIVGSSLIGAWMYLAIRPYEGHWSRLVAMFLGSAGVGTVVTPGLCEAYSFTGIYQHILIAFFSALLAMPMCRAVVAVTESEAVGWIKKAAMRVLGVKDDAPPTDGESSHHDG